MLECVVNLSEGRDLDVLDALVDAAGDALLDAHADADHHRCVFTLASPRSATLERAVRHLARAAIARIDLRTHAGVHPRLGVVDVVPFVALAETPAEVRLARRAAARYAVWSGHVLRVPTFLYDGADPLGRSLPELRRDAFTTRDPDTGPDRADPRRGATAVGARAPLVALNCTVTGGRVVAISAARGVREREGGLPGVRALAFELASTHQWQVSMNLTDLRATGPRSAVRTVRSLARAGGGEVASVELVGLVPVDALRRDGLPEEGIPEHRSIEARLADRAAGAPATCSWRV